MGLDAPAREPLTAVHVVLAEAVGSAMAAANSASMGHALGLYGLNPARIRFVGRVSRSGVARETA